MKHHQQPVDKGIIICADDYGQSASISAGICSLAAQKRINAISCLVNSSYWSEAACELVSCKTTCFIGLHLNLTFGQPLSAMWRKYVGEEFVGLSNLLQKAYLRRLKFDVVKAEIQAQINMFAQTMHCYPDFIDGHQHIHQFPVIREALLAVIAEQKRPVFLRNTHNGLVDFVATTSFPKCQLITLLGGKTFRRRLIRQQIATNTSFAGIYHFSNASRYRRYFKQFLAKSQHGGLIMCHPGQSADDREDPIAQSRHHELNYFLSDVFLSDLEDNSFLLISKKKNATY